MGNQQENEVVFRSKNIEIKLQDSYLSEGISRTYLDESGSSFNLLFLLSPDVHLKAHDCNTQFLFKKNQYILHYSPKKSKAELWTDSEKQLKYLHIQLNYQYIINLINPEANREGAKILDNMIHNHFLFFQKATPLP